MRTGNDANTVLPLDLRRTRPIITVLRQNKIVHGIATSNQRPYINTSLKALGVTKDTVVVDRGDVARAKPESRICSSSARSAWAWKSRTATCVGEGGLELDG